MTCCRGSACQVHHPRPLRIAPSSKKKDNDQDEEARLEDEGKQGDQNHILDEWAQLKLSLANLTKIMGELSTEALAAQGGLSHKPHIAVIIEEVANNMKLVAPNTNEALGLLGAKIGRAHV